MPMDPRVTIEAQRDEIPLHHCRSGYVIVCDGPLSGPRPLLNGWRAMRLLQGLLLQARGTHSYSGELKSGDQRSHKETTARDPTSFAVGNSQRNRIISGPRS